MSIKFVLFSSFFGLIFASTTLWTIKNKYLLNARNIKTENVLRKNNYHDYNFDDWEDTTPLLYFDDTNTETSTQTITVDIDSTITKDLNVTGKVTDDETPHVDDTTVVVTTDTSADNVRTDITTIGVNDTTEPSHYEEPDIPTTNFFISTTNTSDTSTPDIPANSYWSPATENPLTLQLVSEAKLVMDTYKYGYYTSLLIIFMRIVASMDEEPLQTLTLAFYEEIRSAANKNQFVMIGELPMALLLDITEMIASLPADQIKSKAVACRSLFMNRRTQFSPETNAIFDILDNAFQTDDALKLISTFAAIQAFPNVTKSSKQICDEVIENSLFLPYSRIHGTEKERLLMIELDNAVKNRMFGRLRRHDVKQTVTTGYSIRDNIFKHQKNVAKEKQFKYRNYKDAPYKSRIQNSGRQRQHINLKEIKIGKNGSKPFCIFFLFDQFDFDRPKTTSTTTEVGMTYLRNETIMKKVRNRMNLYKEKFKKIRKNEKKTGIKRGKTTPTTAKIPKMRKSKYCIKKYVKKNLYKMKTTTPTTTTTKSKWYRKWYHSDTLNSYSSNSNEIKTSKYVTRDEEWMESTNKDIPVWTVANNFEVYNSNIRNQSKPNVFDRDIKYLENSDYSSDETKLKARVLDVLVHGKEHDLSLYKDNRRFDTKTFRSYSNEEAILKANVYKAFGYENNFDRSKTIRQI